MRPVNVKVYAWFFPFAERSVIYLDKFLKNNYLTFELSYTDQLFTLNYEGEFFPYEEFITKIIAELNSEISGKIDYIDLENWILTRFEVKNGLYSQKSANLDNAIKIHEIYRD